MEHSIKIVSSSEETRAWTRRINFDFDGKQVYLRLYWDEGNGYETSEPDFSGTWSADEVSAFRTWLASYEDNGFSALDLLDELTSTGTLIISQEDN